MGLVKNPGPYFALPQNVAHRFVAQLFGRNIKDRQVAQPDSFQHGSPLGRGEGTLSHDLRYLPLPAKRGEGRGEGRVQFGLFSIRVYPCSSVV